MPFRPLIPAAVLWLLAPAAAQSPLRIAQLSWLEGRWESRQDGRSTQESWLGPKGGQMVGVNLAETKSGGSTFECLRIVENAEGVTYLASPSGRAPVAFKAVELGPRRVVFENPGHDFPQRIIYAMEADGSLKARIEGTVAGQLRGVEWRFTPKAPQR